MVEVTENRFKKECLESIEKFLPIIAVSSDLEWCLTCPVVVIEVDFFNDNDGVPICNNEVS